MLNGLYRVPEGQLLLEDARDLLTMLLSTRNARVVDPAKWVTELDADDGFASLRGIL